MLVLLFRNSFFVRLHPQCANVEQGFPMALPCRYRASQRSVWCSDIRWMSLWCWVRAYVAFAEPWSTQLCIVRALVATSFLLAPLLSGVDCCL